MALRQIYKEGEPVLKKKSRSVTKFDDRLRLLVGDMKETLINAYGVGLAAPQVGVLRRIIVIDAGEKDGVIVLINPEIIQQSGEQEYFEGCLSFPGYFGNVGRPEKITVRANDVYGGSVEYEAVGLYAVACCHEADHLDGVMFMEKVIGRLYTVEEVRALRKGRSGAGKARKPAVADASNTAVEAADAADASNTAVDAADAAVASNTAVDAASTGAAVAVAAAVDDETASAAVDMTSVAVDEAVAAADETVAAVDAAVAATGDEEVEDDEDDEDYDNYGYIRRIQ